MKVWIKKNIIPVEKNLKNSDKYVVVHLTSVNVPKKEIEEFYSFIEANLDNFHTYYLKPKPGHIVAAAIDYTMLCSLPFRS